MVMKAWRDLFSWQWSAGERRVRGGHFLRVEGVLDVAGFLLKMSSERRVILLLWEEEEEEEWRERERERESQEGSKRDREKQSIRQKHRPIRTLRTDRQTVILQSLYNECTFTHTRAHTHTHTHKHTHTLSLSLSLSLSSSLPCPSFLPRYLHHIRSIVDSLSVYITRTVLCLLYAYFTAVLELTKNSVVWQR